MIVFYLKKETSNHISPNMTLCPGRMKNILAENINYPFHNGKFFCSQLQIHFSYLNKAAVCYQYNSALV